ncbi:hypothetical protein SAMN05444278_10978 [Psychroflexus salarius]|uniref:Uncharacterized protein n=1 Tax=Psychroflexus salarius TaxID=1155689 RepID=A0A1M4XLW0_9FLAO|nr:hypothetical protein [Psychroflexus salarius]SHE94587.1 hypothetical protein SAMN05444278_10978 [Psychroflexus salarius]
MPRFKLVKVKSHKERQKELKASIQDLEDKIKSLEDANKALDPYFKRKRGEIDFEI